MSIRLASMFAAALAATVAVSSAEARTPNDTLAGYSATSARPTQGLNTKSHALKRYAKSYNGSKKYSSAKSKRKYASGKGKRSRLARRSVTRYAGGGGGGGTSRSCLQASARALLNRIEQQFGPVSLVSTCRAGAVIATSGKPSKHRYGLAIDFDAGGRKGAIVKWLLANHHSGGTMTYRDMSHIHVDIGPRFVQLGANSGRG